MKHHEDDEGHEGYEKMTMSAAVRGKMSDGCDIIVIRKN